MTDLTWNLELKAKGFSEIERQNAQIYADYNVPIQAYKRELEILYNTGSCLEKHNITPALRARMVDWMIEVLTNFKCDDQTFFVAVSLLDRFLKNKQDC